MQNTSKSTCICHRSHHSTLRISVRHRGCGPGSDIGASAGDCASILASLA